MQTESKLYTFDNIFSKGQLKTAAGEILQISELSIVKGSQIVSHTQWCDEITFFIQGHGHVVSGTEVQEINKGDVHFVRSGTNHSIRADEGENIRFFCIGYIADEKNPACKELYSHLCDKTHFLHSDHGNIKHLCELLIREFYSYDNYSVESTGRYLEQLFCELTRDFCGHSSNVNGKITSIKSSALYKTLRYIDREYISINSVKEICDALSYSEFYLSHLFREKMNMSIKEYLMNKKISHAAELLKTTNLSIEEISDYFGFSSSHSFRRAFKQYTGLVPKSFKDK